MRRPVDASRGTATRCTVVYSVEITFPIGNYCRIEEEVVVVVLVVDGAVVVRLDSKKSQGVRQSFQ